MRKIGVSVRRLEDRLSQHPYLVGDTFTLADMYRIYTGKHPSTPAILSESEKRELVLVLKGEDLKRRREEARTLLNNH